ncbi:MAG: hypothetical protein M5U28_27685 [Sandaracinaceae bacterium]|nr:hypothetical protein [Sandaracinaceae bacterium]
MMSLRTLALGLLFAVTLPLAACGTEGNAEAQQRCELCGMRIDPRSGWRAGGRGASGEVLFDTPKCLFPLPPARGRRPRALGHRVLLAGAPARA